MVDMAVRVSDDQLVVLARVLGEPRLDDLVHRLAQGVALGLLARPGVEEHRPFTPEQQVQKGCLGGEGLALPQHICVPVVPVHLDGRVGVLGAAGRSVNPADIEIAAKEILYMRAKMFELLGKHTGQPLDVIGAAVERDRFMTPMEAKEFGLIDEVVESRPTREEERGFRA